MKKRELKKELKLADALIKFLGNKVEELMEEVGQLKLTRDNLIKQLKEQDE